MAAYMEKLTTVNELHGLCTLSRITSKEPIAERSRKKAKISLPERVDLAAYILEQETLLDQERIHVLDMMNEELVCLGPGDRMYTRIESTAGHVLFTPQEIVSIQVRPRETNKVPASACIQGEVRLKSLNSCTFTMLSFTSGYSTTCEMRKSVRFLVKSVYSSWFLAGMVEMLPMRLGEVEDLGQLQTLYASFFQLDHKQSLTFVP